MKLARNVKAISKLLLILLLLTALIIGAILSYLWVIGYYVSLGIRVPEKTTVSITNVIFNPQDTSYFNVTLLNPSYSPTDATIKQIAASPRDDFICNVPPDETYPQLPCELPKAEEKTFVCTWDWANYTGKTVKIIVFVADGSGPTFEAETPLVDLRITDVRFNSTINVTHFNMTVQNLPSSVTYVNITEVSIDPELIPPENLSISLPYPLDANESVSFTCTWNWTNYQNKSVTVAVHTLQGYVAYYAETLPPPVILEINEVLFDIIDTNPYFNVTVQNSKVSPTYVNVTGIDATVDGVPLGVDVSEKTPLLYGLSNGTSQVFMCFCNWTGYRNKDFTIGVRTLQGFTKYRTEVTPAPAILEITAVQFSLTNATRLNITVTNSRISLVDVNITHITVTLEDDTPENITEITPPYLLRTNESKTFACTWNWSAHGGINATFTAYAVGYSANATELVPEPVIVITDVVFDPADPTHFNVTVKNPPLSLMVANVTNITVTVEGGFPENITDTDPPLPYPFQRKGESQPFKCLWNWTDYLGNKTTVTVTTLPGYVTSYNQSIPIIALINITSVVFGNNTNPYFNVTILNPQSSLTYAHLTEITVTLGNGTAQNVAVEGPPYLPHILHRDQTVTFMCLWDWTAHIGETVVIKAKTLEGYEAAHTITITLP